MEILKLFGKKSKWKKNEEVKEECRTNWKENAKIIWKRKSKEKKNEEVKEECGKTEKKILKLFG